MCGHLIIVATALLALSLATPVRAGSHSAALVAPDPTGAGRTDSELLSPSTIIETLFDSSTTSIQEVQTNITRLASLIDTNHEVQELIESITVAQALGLLQFIVYSVQIDMHQKKELLRILNYKIRVPYLNDRTYLGLKRFYKDAIPDVETNAVVEYVVLPLEIPPRVAEIIQYEVRKQIKKNKDAAVGNRFARLLNTLRSDTSAQDQTHIDQHGHSNPNQMSQETTIQDGHVSGCRKRMRRVYRQPYCCAHAMGSEITRALLNEFVCYPVQDNPLSDPDVLLDLLQNGIVFDQAEYFQGSKMSPATVAAEVTPLLGSERRHFQENIFIMLSALTSEKMRPGRSLENLQIPVIRRFIRDSPGDVTEFIAEKLMKSGVVWSGLGEVPFMQDIINLRFDCYRNAMHPSILGFALYYKKWDALDVLLVALNASLFHSDDNGETYSVFATVIQSEHYGDVLQHLLVEERFQLHQQASQDLMERELRMVIRSSEGLSCCRWLRDSKYFRNFPKYFQDIIKDRIEPTTY